MNAVYNRPRRTSSRLSNNMTSVVNSDTNANYTGNQMCYNPNLHNGQSIESRIIYEQPDVHFRPLPFFDELYQIIKPAGLISDGITQRPNESQVEFKLTIDQANMLAMSPNSKHILLRFCNLVTNCEQNDNFPVDVSVTVNGIPISLPAAIHNPNKPNLPAKRLGQHVDITKQCKLCPFIPNVVSVKWYVDPTEPSRSYALTVVAVDHVDADTLLQRIKDRGLIDPAVTKRLIIDSDQEVATTNLQSSLNCPVGKIRMSMPCKSTKCQHIPCFDALCYLKMNERRPEWTCPVCEKAAYFPDLMIDGLFMSILENADSSVTEVTLHADGSWSPVIKAETSTSAKNPPPEIITISDDDE